MRLFSSANPARVDLALRLRALAIFASVAAIAACNDSLGIKAQLEVASDTLVATALSGSAPNARSALFLRGIPAVAAPEAAAGADFDLAVDIDAAGQAVLYPARLVSLLAPRRVQLRRVSETYESLTRAARGTYVADSGITMQPGDVVSVQVPAVSGECIYASSPYFYSKLVVDSVRLSERLIFVRATTNPNCGFRSFAPGIPRD